MGQQVVAELAGNGNLMGAIRIGCPVFQRLHQLRGIQAAEQRLLCITQVLAVLPRTITVQVNNKQSALIVGGRQRSRFRPQLAGIVQLSQILLAQVIRLGGS